MSEPSAHLDEAWRTRRRPVWIALSELWLDTELDAAALTSIVNAMVDSGFSLAELREIYFVELAPVVGSNLRVGTGAWSGFDPARLEARIVENLTTRSRRTRFLAAFPLTRWWWTGNEVHFPALLERVRVSRESNR